MHFHVSAFRFGLHLFGQLIIILIYYFIVIIQMSGLPIYSTTLLTLPPEGTLFYR
jgi:hypothetical protein